MWWLHEMPLPVAQIALMFNLLLIIGMIGVFVYTLFIQKMPTENRLTHPHRWAATISGACAYTAFLQWTTSSWFQNIFDKYSDIEAYPYGPPSEVVRFIIDHPDFPLETAVRNFLFFDPWLTAYLGAMSGISAILAAWIDPPANKSSQT